MDHRDIRTLAHRDAVVGPQYATFAEDVPDLSSLAAIILPEFDPNLSWGPCPWQSRDEVSLPQKGDPCLVIFDNRRDPWIVAWWPFT